MDFLKIFIGAISGIIRGFGVMLGGIGRGILQPVRSIPSAVFKFRPGEFKRPIIVAFSSLVIVGSLTSIVLSQWRPSVKLNLAPSEGLGEAVGEEAAKLIGGKGQVVIWRWDFGAKASPLQRAEWESFQKSLKKYAGIAVAAVEEDRLQATHPMEMGVQNLPNGRLAALLDKYRWMDEVVLFGAVPQLDEDEISKLVKHHPRVLVVARGYGLRKHLLEDGVVQVAIVPRWPLTNATEKPVTAHDWFEHYFMVVTSQNANGLPN